MKSNEKQNVSEVSWYDVSTAALLPGVSSGCGSATVTQAQTTEMSKEAAGLLLPGVNPEIEIEFNKQGIRKNLMVSYKITQKSLRLAPKRIGWRSFMH